MQTLVPADAHVRPQSASSACDYTPPPEPYQLPFVSPLPGTVAGEASDARENGPAHISCAKRQRRRRCRSLTVADVAKSAGSNDALAFLRKRAGECLLPLYARHLTNEGDVMQPADAATILDSAEALLAHRFQRGVKILRDPFLLLRFLRIRLVSQPQPVFPHSSWTASSGSFNSPSCSAAC